MESEKPKPLGRSDWIAAAHAMFERKGVEAVRVDPLARSLGVTRGSFYWHFKDHADLVRAVLDRWQVEQTDAVIEQNEAAGGAPEARLLRLLETCAGDDGRFEMGIRTWMGRDAGARQVVERVDRRRIGYIAALLEETGMAPEMAARRAPVAYSSWLGEYSGAVPADPERQLQTMRALFELIVSR